MLGQLNHLIGPVEGHNWNKSSLTLAVTFLGTTFPVDGHARLTLSASNLEMSDNKASVADTLLHSYSIRVTKAATSHDFDLLRVLTLKTVKYHIAKVNILTSFIFKINIVNFPANIQQENIKEAMKEKGFPEEEILQLTFRMKSMNTNPQTNKKFSKHHNVDDTIMAIYFKVKTEQLLQQVLNMVCISLPGEEEKTTAIFQESISNFPPKRYFNNHIIQIYSKTIQYRSLMITNVSTLLYSLSNMVGYFTNLFRNFQKVSKEAKL